MPTKYRFKSCRREAKPLLKMWQKNQQRISKLIIPEIISPFAVVGYEVIITNEVRQILSNFYKRTLYCGKEKIFSKATAQQIQAGLVCSTLLHCD